MEEHPETTHDITPETYEMTRIESVQTIPYLRRKQGRRYPLTVLLLITIMSMMSGDCRYREIAAFAKANQHALLIFFT